ncbi:MAG: hypothetical protein IKK18_04005 [Clostridia bacterium]|nr:hypothetical protein [Clostridia bacterium]
MIFEKGIKVSVYGLYVGLKLFGILSGQGSDLINKKILSLTIISVYLSATDFYKERWVRTWKSAHPERKE